MSLSRRSFLKHTALGAGLLTAGRIAAMAQRDFSGRPELSTLIFQALERGEKKINIPEGNYALELRGARPMRFENLKEVEINGNGSDVLCRIPSLIAQFRNCEHVTFKGFSFDSAVLPFTQGTVAAVDSARGLWLDVKNREC